MSVRIAPPVFPFRGVRGVDSWGSGVFGASRDKGGRQHKGLDFVAVQGDAVVAPIMGRVILVGIAYTGSTLGSIHIQGLGEFADWRCKILYAAPDMDLMGRLVQQGDQIGHAQDVSGYWAKMEPARAGLMTNHVHLEILATEQRNIDPAHFLPEGLVVPVAGLET